VTGASIAEVADKLLAIGSGMKNDFAVCDDFQAILK
jgi:hypothetical protein